jgi:hypothetical protein
MNQQEAQPSGTPVSRRKQGETVSIKPSESNEIEQAFNSLKTPVKTSGKAAIMRAPEMKIMREKFSLQISQVERQILRLVKARKSSAQNEERTEDGNAGTAESTDNQSNNDAGTTHRISTEAKDELHKYFTTKAFNINQDFRPLTEEISAIMDKYKLTNKQVSRQLGNWKNKKYNFHGVVYSHSMETIRDAITAHMVGTENSIDFVMKVITGMMPPTVHKRSSEAFSIFQTKFCRRRERGKELLEIVLDQENGLIAFFDGIVEEYHVSSLIQCFLLHATWRQPSCWRVCSSISIGPSSQMNSSLT